MISAMIWLVLIGLFLLTGFYPVYAAGPIAFTVTSTADAPDATDTERRGNQNCAGKVYRTNPVLRLALMDCFIPMTDHQNIAGG